MRFKSHFLLDLDNQKVLHNGAYRSCKMLQAETAGNTLIVGGAVKEKAAPPAAKKSAKRKTASRKEAAGS